MSSNVGSAYASVGAGFKLWVPRAAARAASGRLGVTSFSRAAQASLFTNTGLRRFLLVILQNNF
jgi:photosystem II stability/assembly factor-like uncharacterized protein